MDRHRRRNGPGPPGRRPAQATASSGAEVVARTLTEMAERTLCRDVEAAADA